MKLYCVTITGISDDTDMDEVLRLSEENPWLEWGVLLSETSMDRPDKPRYASRGYIQELKARAYHRKENFNHPYRLAAHLCGKTCRRFVPGITFDGYDQGKWLEPFGLDESSFNFMFNRAQANFNASAMSYDAADMGALIQGWYESFDGNLITQHNDNNFGVWEAIQREEVKSKSVRAHHILHDASGGRGEPMTSLEPPIAGVLNGYAGGINDENINDLLTKLAHHIVHGYTWIDMETGVRDEHDEMDMDKVHRVIESINKTWDFILS